MRSLFATTLFLFITFSFSFGQAPNVLFPNNTCYDMTRSTGQSDLIAADFNNDKINDIISINKGYLGFDGISYFKGKLNGTFETVKYFQTQGLDPTSASITDLNKDGNLDLLITNSGSNKISVLKGTGNDSFYYDTFYTVKKTPLSITQGFFNKDTLPDFLVACKDSNMIAFLPGKPGGLIDTVRYIKFTKPVFITTGNLNGDNYNDVVILTENNDTAGIGLGGDTLYGIRITSKFRTAYFSISASIIDIYKKDAYDEILITGSLPAGSNKGFFRYSVDSTGKVTQTYQVGPTQGWVLTAGDLNHDGFTDMISGSEVFINQGDTVFQPPVLYSNIGAYDGAIYDVNKDGKSDFVRLATTSFCVTLGVGDGTLHANRLVYDPATFYLEDFNKDQIQDMVYFDVTSYKMYVAVGIGDGKYAETFRRNNIEVTRLLIEDYNKDGWMDIAVEDRNYDSLYIFYLDSLSKDNDSLFFSSRKNVLNKNIDWQGQLLRGHFNRDSLIDIISTGASLKDIALYTQTTNSGSPFKLAGNFYASGRIIDALVADVNKDSIDDLIACVNNGTTDGISVSLGDTSGILSASTYYPGGKSPLNIAKGDINNDGYVDFVTSDRSARSMTLFLNNKNGTFKPVKYPLSSYSATERVWAGHLDADSNVDIVIGVTDTASWLLFYWGNGTDSLSIPVKLLTYPNSYITVNDLNGDGLGELILNEGTHGNVSVYKNNGNSTFSPSIVNTIVGPGYLKAVDFNGDLKKDIVCQSYPINNHNVIYMPNKTAIITNPNDTFCNYADLDAGLGDTYLWSTGGTTRKIRVTQSGNYWVRIKNVDDSVSQSVTRNIVIKSSLSAPPIISSSPNGFCKGDSIFLKAIRNPNYSYKWLINDSVIKSFTDTFAWAKKGGVYHLVMTNLLNNCIDSSHIPVMAGDKLNVNITSNKGNIICYGDSALLSTAVNDTAYKYQWLNDSLPIAGATKRNYTTKTKGSFSLLVSDSGCVNTSNKIGLQVDSLPLPQLNLSGTVSFCLNDTAELYTLHDSSVLYEWYRNSTKIINTNSEKYNTKIIGNYNVKIIRGNCSRVSNIVELVNHPKTTVSINASKPLNFCLTDSNLVQSNSTGAPKEYHWYRNGVPLINPTSFINVNQSGTYKLITVNLYGCFDTSNTLTLNSVPLPTAHIAFIGDTVFCDGNSLILNANSGAGITYKWFKNNTVINGQTSKSLTVNTTGFYKVEIDSICTATSTPVSVVVNPKPSKPLITKNHNTLTSSAPANNQWYLNGVLINGATNQNYSAKTNGSYSVTVTNQWSCSNTSDIFPLTILGIKTEKNENKLKIAPNPNEGEFMLSSEDIIVYYQLYDMTGKLLLQNEVNNNSAFIKLEIPKGIYMIKCYLKEGYTFEKIIID